MSGNESGEPPAQGGGQSGEDAPDETDTRAAKRNAGLGRRLVLSVWVVGIVYITIVTFSSIVPQAFWPEYAEPEHLQPSERCESELRGLYDELMNHAAAETRDPTPDPERDLAVYAAWDQRHQSLTGRCDARLHNELGRLRYRIHTSLRRYERDEGRLARTLARRLAGTDAAPADERGARETENPIHDP